MPTLRRLDLLYEIARPTDGIVVFQKLPVSGARICDVGVVDEAVQRIDDGVRFVVFDEQLAGDSKAHEMMGVVELVEGHRSDKLRDSGAQRLAGGADTAVVDDGGAPGEEEGEGDVVEVPDTIGEMLRQLVREPGEEHAPAPRPHARLGRFGKEGPIRGGGGSGCEEDRSRTFREVGFDFG